MDVYREVNFMSLLWWLEEHIAVLFWTAVFRELAIYYHPHDFSLSALCLAYVGGLHGFDCDSNSHWKNILGFVVLHVSCKIWFNHYVVIRVMHTGRSNWHIVYYRIQARYIQYTPHSIAIRASYGVSVVMESMFVINITCDPNSHQQFNLCLIVLLVSPC